MGTGSAYGKTILFGSHFVVYGFPAIASAISNVTTCNVERIDADTYELIDDRPETTGYKEKKFDEQKVSIENVFNASGLSTSENPVLITFAGDLTAASGVGSSAASCAALARALNDEFNLGFNDDRINDIAYEGEKGYHGIPSGLDNTASVYGGLVWFIKNLEGGQNTMERINIREPVEIVLGNTGMTSSTQEVVADVRKHNIENPEKFEKIFKKYAQVVGSARDALEDFDIPRVGALMNECHTLLQDITVSCSELDLLVDTARNAGALGAKMTGTGRGGLMHALTPGEELQDTVARAIEDAGYKAYKSRIGV